MQRVDATHARWTFTTPITALTDPFGLEINGGAPGATVISGDALSILATYGSGVAVGNSWVLDDGSVEVGGGPTITGQDGRVV